jgi:hypothetical protein
LQAPFVPQEAAPWSAHATAQQMFPAQLPLAHWVAPLHADPLASPIPHTPELQTSPAMQSPFVEHEVLHVVPPHL